MPSYYETHKDALKTKMRERDAERRAKVKEAAKTDPVVAEKEREKMRVKYHKQTESKVKRTLLAFLDDMTLSPIFKTYVRQVLLADDKYKLLTPASINLMKEVSTIHKDAPKEREDEREFDFTDLFTSDGDGDADDEGGAAQDN